MTTSTLGGALRLARTWAGRGSAEAAVAVGITRASLSAYEAGKRIPAVELCLHLADLYGLSLDQLVGRASLPLPVARPSPAPAPPTPPTPPLPAPENTRQQRRPSPREADKAARLRELLGKGRR